MSQPTQFLLYTAPDGAVKVDVFLKNETVWLTQKAPVATISKMEIVRTEGTREVARDGGCRKEFHNPFGVVINWARLPRVARSSQPWALRRNPVGILGRRI